jgi:hypothetical protein
MVVDMIFKKNKFSYFICGKGGRGVMLQDKYNKATKTSLFLFNLISVFDTSCLL